jgi:hypothetical protein
MPADAGTLEGLRPLAPPVQLHRCPVCGEPGVPILSDAQEATFWAICPSCSFEGRFPARTRAASRVRTWIASETRRRRSHPSGEPPQPRLSRAEYVAEVGGPSGGG